MCVWGEFGVMQIISVDKHKQCGLCAFWTFSPQIHQQAACPPVAGIILNIGRAINKTAPI